MATLLTNARIINGEGEVFVDHALLIDGDEIVDLAARETFAGTSAEIRDLSGATIVPGLIDCHVHLCYAGEPNPGRAVEDLSPGQTTIRALANAQQTLRGGVTSVRDCGGVDYLEFAVRDGCNNGTFLGPTIRAAGRMICMTGGHGNRFGRIADGVDEVVKAVREQVHAGSDLVKIMATGGVMTPGVNPEDAHYSAEEMAAGIAEGHRFHKRCASHAQGTEGILNAVRGGIDSIEHGIFMSDECIEEMVAQGTYLVPTLAALANILDGADKVPEYVIEKAQRIAETHRQSFVSYYQAGGKVAMGTDAGTPFNMHGANADELHYMVKNGMTPMDAIIASTANAADLMGLPERGRLKAGQKADLLVVQGDPLSDIAMVADRANHQFVMKNGQYVNS
ncbi:MAG: amidohydrolase family protein [Gammaproteobacteria bacterium]|nr:amidohydrolase family protein [Gammaproteobacteria bacterium]